MAWSASKIFVTFIEDVLENTAAYNLATDAPKCALYNNTPTPDNTVTTANRAFNAGQWATAQEVYDGAEWATGGVVLTSPLSTTAAAVYTYDGTDVVSTGTSATLAAVFGCLVYDDTVAGDYGMCYNYFGGTNSVTDGTFTIVWAGTGIFTITLT